MHLYLSSITSLPPSRITPLKPRLLSSNPFHPPQIIMAPPDYDTTGIEFYTFPSFRFQSGLELPIKVAYRSINPSSPKTVLIPTCYGGLINDTLSFTSPPCTSLSSYHVIIVDMLGAGESSSPSNKPSFPPSVSYIDCINHNTVSSPNT
jgi:hypothetical protein